MPWKEIALIVIGAILGFTLTVLHDYIKIIQSRRKQQRFGTKLLSAIIPEIEEGVHRCRSLVNLRNKEKVSYSRIYVALWESMKQTLHHNIENLQVLRILHSIYYRFDLVNFNMEREEFGVGAAYASEYLSEMEDNLAKLKVVIKEKGKEAMKRPLRNLVLGGIGLGVISVILGIIAKFVGGMLRAVSALAYLRFAQTCLLGSIGVGVLGVLQSKER